MSAAEDEAVTLDLLARARARYGNPRNELEDRLLADRMVKMATKEERDAILRLELTDRAEAFMDADVAAGILTVEVVDGEKHYRRVDA